MMPNNQPMMGEEHQPTVPVGPSPAAQGEEGNNPEAIKQQLVMLLTQAKKVAENNGVNFEEVLAQVNGNKVKSDVPLPRSAPAPGY